MTVTSNKNLKGSFQILGRGQYFMRKKSTERNWWEIFLATVEFRFYKPLRETKIGSKNWRVQEIESKIPVFDWGGETTFGSSYQEVRKTEGLRNRDSTVNFVNLFVTLCTRNSFKTTANNTPLAFRNLALKTLELVLTPLNIYNSFNL